MIVTVLITLFIEGSIALGYCIRFEKPVRPVLFTSICGNLITQSILWILLDLFFLHYLIVLLAVEILLWMLEALLLYAVPANRLKFREAALLSLSMNLVSFMLGWLLPV